MTDYPFFKGHGTENDFVIVPAEVELTDERVRALCDRRAGIGGDGVIRAVRGEDRWFMDYRNSDGSVSEMCGNGIRLFALYLRDHEGVVLPARDRHPGRREDTHPGRRRRSPSTWAARGCWPRPRSPSTAAPGRPPTSTWATRTRSPSSTTSRTPARCSTPPDHDDAVYPAGVNVEFVVRRGAAHVAMRVHERGSGETRSCGTGAGAVMVAAAVADGAERARGLPGRRARRHAHRHLDRGRAGAAHRPGGHRGVGDDGPLSQGVAPTSSTTTQVAGLQV